ncbi:MAG: hypothetical protein NC338_01350 [Firmicutes bacterium]|nr:hypothetical protein [Bacillota bacterium]MCM1401036.1 hypothetical protein [Bacteroides sp.]MCM1476955.1 hypothetical protein [Bacteroides sp.]
MKNLRDRDFMRECRRIAANSKERLTMSQVAVAASRVKAPEFYLSYDYALRQLRTLTKREFKGISRCGAKAVFLELRKRVDRIMKRSNLSEADALLKVLLDGNAPRFYLTEGAAVNLLSRLRAKSKLKNITKF